MSDYLDIMYNKIKELHDSVLEYRRITYWLNKHEYKKLVDMSLKIIISIPY